LLKASKQETETPKEGGTEAQNGLRNEKGKMLKAEPITPRFTALHPALRGSHTENKG